MDERVVAGLKAGILCGVAIFITLLIFCLEIYCCLVLVGLIIGFALGTLAVHFGKSAIKNGKDVAVSCVVAGIVSPLSFISLLALIFAISSRNQVTGEDLGLFFLMSLPVTLGISVIEGLLYAKLKLGIPFIGQQTVPSGAQPAPYKTHCPRCGNKMDKMWISCPYCGYDLRDDTQIYDDKTQIY